MARNGYHALAVPTDLGGSGAGVREVVLAQLELGRHSGPVALSAAMHLYLSLVQCWRRRRGAPDAEGALRKVANDGLILATSGGSDWVCPTTTVVAVEGGFRFTGRKKFCSQAPVATVMSTSATLGEPGPDAEVLHASVPFASPGVTIVETWDTLGMRGTASHDVQFDDVFVPADKITGRRPYGELAGPLLVAAIHFAPVAGAAYLGIAFGAFGTAQRALRDQPTPSPAAVRTLGEMRARLRVARWGPAPSSTSRWTRSAGRPSSAPRTWNRPTATSVAAPFTRSHPRRHWRSSGTSSCGRRPDRPPTPTRRCGALTTSGRRTAFDRSRSRDGAAPTASALSARSPVIGAQLEFTSHTRSSSPSISEVR